MALHWRKAFFWKSQCNPRVQGRQVFLLTAAKSRFLHFAALPAAPAAAGLAMQGWRSHPKGLALRRKCLGGYQRRPRYPAAFRQPSTIISGFFNSGWPKQSFGQPREFLDLFRSAEFGGTSLCRNQPVFQRAVRTRGSRQPAVCLRTHTVRHQRPACHCKLSTCFPSLCQRLFLDEFSGGSVAEPAPCPLNLVFGYEKWKRSLLKGGGLCGDQ